MTRTPIITSAFLLAFLLGSQPPPSTAEAEPPLSPGALWIADETAAIELGTGAARWKSRIPSEHAIVALAVDAERQRLWLLSGTTLSAVGFGGAPLWSFEVPPISGERAFLAVVPDDGAIWLGAGNRLLSFGAAGQPLHRLELSATIENLAIDSGRSVLWVIDADGIVSFDAVSGLEAQRVDAPAGVVDVDVDPASGHLWVAREDGLRRHDPEGAERLGVPIEGLRAVAADDRGGLWIAAGAELRKLGAPGDDGPALAPFGEGGHIERLVFDPSHRAIWAVAGSQLAKVSASGEVLATLDMATLDLVAAARPGALALFAGAVDGEPPRLDLDRGVSAHPIDPSRRTLRLSYRDVGSGVDPSSLDVRLRELDDPLECVVQTGGARCHLAADPGLERFTLVASVADHMGNLAEASLGLAVAARGAAGQDTDEGIVAPLEKGGIPSVGDKGGGGLAGERIPSLRGLLPSQAFLSDGEVESINTANGNLNLSVPLGQIWRVGPHISYQLRATHNSDAWDHATVQCSHTNSGCQTTFGPVLVALPHRSANAGAGWSVQLGQLFAPAAPTGSNTLDRQTWSNRDHASVDIGERWLYVSPDGGSHHLYKLNGRTTSHNGLPLRYAKDGSQLRMRQISANTVIVEHPNGVISQFEKTNSHLGTSICGNGLGGCWRFKEQRDYYGNRMWVTYSQSGSTEIWKIQDSTSRVHRIYFRLDNAFRAGGDATALALKMPNGDQLGDLRRVVDRVDLASAGGGIARYQFRYSIQNIYRSRPHDPTGSLAPGNERIRVPMLTRIEVPDSPDYRLTHYTDFVRSGRVATIQFPTQGKYQYLYGNWFFPTACVYQNDPDAELQFSKGGISQKRHLRPDGTEIARWTYSSQLFPGISGDQISGPNCKRADYRRALVNSPTVGGRYTQRRFYHAVTLGPKLPSGSDPIGDWQVTDNGLPFTKSTKIGSNNSNYLFLSEETYDCNPSCVKKRETFVRYAMERRSCSTILIGKDPPSCFQVNPIRVRERTIFNDDSNRWLENKHTHHDGAGNTRRRFILDNFNGSTRQVEHRTNYNATGSTTLSENPSTGYLTVGSPGGYLPGATDPWILTPFDYELRIDNGRTYRTNYRFDTKGSITCIRKRKLSGADNSRDVVRRLFLGASVGNNAGLPVTEILAGGENGALGSGVCNTAGSEGTNRFTWSHTYAYYSKASTRIGGYPYRFRADIDRNTGLPSATYNKSDQKTSIFYDRLARPIRIAPTSSLGEAETLFTYGLTGGGESDVQIRRRFGATTYFSERLIYDFFGRLRREIQSIPTSVSGSSSSERETVYDASGRVTAVSTVQQASNVDNTTKTTRFFGYDPFGRPSRVVRADGRDEILSYKGERETRSTVAIRTSETGTSNVTTTTTRDGMGRTVSVRNPEYMTVSFFDPNNKLIAAERRRGGFTQRREYG
ncbi:MAG: hypothetical protein MI919_39835, partial [Holophagales bacterium]|nr:hypothetical protein [Holophagales bacterium]